MRRSWIFGFFMLSSCSPTLEGRLKAVSGELSVSPEARVNITGLSPDSAEERPRVVVVSVAPDGTFSTDASLPEGSYLVEALVPGYKAVSSRVQIGKAEGLELTLTPLASPKPSAVGANVDTDAGRGAGGALLTPPQL